MEEENQNKNKMDLALPVSIVVGALIIAGAWFYVSSNSGPDRKTLIGETDSNPASFSQKEVELPVRWGDLGRQLVEAGAVDPQKFEALYQNRGGLSREDKKLLYGGAANLKIAPGNSGVVLNLLWALGLANQNVILEKGPISQYGDASRFASTGGWTLAAGNPMMHYNAHQFINLTPEQQELVKEISQNIYRPCCNNPTHFPDCNHGMAMLGLLELMASRGASKEKMYETALKVNSYWFPDQYLTIAKFLKSKDIDWNKTSPEKILGKEFSSASGFQWVSEQVVQPEENGPDGGCAA